MSFQQISRVSFAACEHLEPDSDGDFTLDLCAFIIKNIALFFHIQLAVAPVDFAMKIQEVKAEEREDALFECVLTQPQNQIVWTLKNTPLTNSEKFEITVSEDKLIHRLKVIDCMPLDTGIYAAIAGIKSSSAWLIVEGTCKKATFSKHANSFCKLNLNQFVILFPH